MFRGPGFRRTLVVSAREVAIVSAWQLRPSQWREQRCRGWRSDSRMQRRRMASWPLGRRRRGIDV